MGAASQRLVDVLRKTNLSGTNVESSNDVVEERVTQDGEVTASALDTDEALIGLGVNLALEDEVLGADIEDVAGNLDAKVGSGGVAGDGEAFEVAAILGWGIELGSDLVDELCAWKLAYLLLVGHISFLGQAEVRHLLVWRMARVVPLSRIAMLLLPIGLFFTLPLVPKW
jgi:hypothetical protein